jgi:hypothetical protein
MPRPNDTNDKLDLTDEEFKRFVDVLDAPPSTGVVRLAQLAGLSRDRAFRHAILHGVAFTKDDTLDDYDFTAADFMGADVTGADFRKSTGLKNAHFTGFIGDDKALWPPNLRPIGSLVFIPPGRFTMGTTKAEAGRENLPDDGAKRESPPALSASPRVSSWAAIRSPSASFAVSSPKPVVSFPRAPTPSSKARAINNRAPPTGATPVFPRTTATR